MTNCLGIGFGAKKVFQLVWIVAKFVFPNILFVNYFCVVAQVATQFGKLCGYFNENQIYQYGDLKHFFSLLVTEKLKNHFFFKI